MENKVITVTSPLLPSLDDFIPYLQDIWNRKWLTNNGHYHQELEKALCEYLKVPYISLFTNGTLPLIVALQALRITGEVITTPYSFVATTHALWWNGIKPVFVDIDPETCNIDPEKIEAAITPKTTAIMPVHVYGKPCDTERIQAIADKYGLKVIYDAAHVFGVEVNGKSVLNAGDMSTLSFHATKVYNAEKYGMTRDELYFKMKERNVLGRRYFYPLISEFSTYRGLESARAENLLVAHKAANSVICLPMYHSLNEIEIDEILNLIIK